MKCHIDQPEHETNGLDSYNVALVIQSKTPKDFQRSKIIQNKVGGYKARKVGL